MPVYKPLHFADDVKQKIPGRDHSSEFILIADHGQVPKSMGPDDPNVISDVGLFMNRYGISCINSDQAC